MLRSGRLSASSSAVSWQVGAAGSAGRGQKLVAYAGDGCLRGGGVNARLLPCRPVDLSAPTMVRASENPFHGRRQIGSLSVLGVRQCGRFSAAGALASTARANLSKIRNSYKGNHWRASARLRRFTKVAGVSAGCREDASGEESIRSDQIAYRVPCVVGLSRREPAAVEKALFSE